MRNPTLSPPIAGEDTAFAFREPMATDEEFTRLPSPLQLRFAAWLRLSGDLERANELVNGIADRSGETAALLDELAALALARGDGAAVRGAWERRLQRHPAPSARAAYARALLELGDLAEAAAIVEELVVTHWELATVQAVAAEIALQQGDLATAHDYWLTQLAEDSSRISPQLALARIALLGGDADEARAILSTVLADLDALTPAQLASAAGLAELLGQPFRAHVLRLRYARLESERVTALATAIDEALGRLPATASYPSANGDAREEPEPAPGEVVAAVVDPADADDAIPTIAEEPIDDPRVMPALSEVYGYQSLLPGQAAVINRVLAGTDTLAILPTGAGKSLTFQLPALLLPGTTLVLSPLIALMKDQVDGLPAALREKSVLINSSLSPDQQWQALDAVAGGEVKLVYAAPERLRQQSFLRVLRQAGVSLVVVDEAHCISLWGHDFRPDYLSIPAALPELGNPPLLAMTATASPDTAASLSAAFHRDLDVVRTSAFRPNLYYSAEKLATKEEKARRVVALCRELPGQGIVYVSSRRDAENLAGVLRDNGVSAVPYHAGLEPRLRAENQHRFMRGAARVVVATVAFGMGIDKPDVRFIIHFSPSTSLEAYAQESGRAGRDALDARCVLLYTSADRASQTRLARRDAMDLATLRQIYSGIMRHASGSWAIFDPSRIVVTGSPGDDPDELPDPRIGIGLLEEGGLLERHPNAPVTWTLTRLDGDEGDLQASDEDDAALWGRFAAWADLLDDDFPGKRVHIQTAAACDALGVSPDTLARVLDRQTAWEVSEGARLPCLRLLPAGADAGTRLQRVIDAAADRAKRRVDRMIAYADGRRCRHTDLAAHLGERLPPCGDACDVCTDDRATVSGPHARREPQPRKRISLTLADVSVALKALKTAPFPVGKTGLVRLLEGSIQSRIQGDRSPYFGALTGVQKSKIGSLVDLLVEEGELAYDRSRDFPVLRLTREAEARLRQLEHDTTAATDELHVHYVNAPQPTPSQSSTGLEDNRELSSEDLELFGRLQDWRQDRAVRDGVPAYVIAQNAWLAEIAQRRVRTLGELSSITGFGEIRIEKYGDEILTVVAGDTVAAIAE